MRPFFIVILLFSFAAQSFGTMWLYVDYKINLDKYARNCVNKARPTLHCNGKCQLAKKIKEEESKKQQDAEKSAPHIDYVLSSKHFFLSIDDISIVASRRFYVRDAAGEIKMPRFIFHPPCNPS